MNSQKETGASVVSRLTTSILWQRTGLTIFLLVTVVLWHPPYALTEEPPRIVPPRPPAIKVIPKPKKLPKTAHAIFPAFDGDGFFVAIPPRASLKDFTGTQVFKDIVGPVLASIGFNPHTGLDHTPQQSRIRIPAHTGLARPSADLKKLAKLTCQEFSDLSLVTTRQVCEALTGQVPVLPGDSIDKLFNDRMGLTYQQYVDDIQRRELEYFFTQVHSNPALHTKPVPIEHAGVRATRWKGETMNSVTGRVINSYKVTNTIKLTKAGAIARAPKSLAKVPGVCCWQKVALSQVELLLLEYGGSAGKPALRYVYRMPILGEFEGVKGLFYLWLDADTGSVLELLPLIHHQGVPAKGQTFDRSPDPGTAPHPDTVPPQKLLDFEVDPASGPKYTLKLSTLFANQIGTVSIAETSPGSSSSFANFDQAPYNNLANSWELACLVGGNQEFQHIDLMATLTRHLNLALSAGMYNFPTTNKIIVQWGSNSCNSSADFGGPTLGFGYCDYGQNPTGAGHVSQCPPLPSLSPDNIVIRSFNDHTVVAHEFGHMFTSTQYQYPTSASSPFRPSTWCNGPTFEGTSLPCPVPIGQELFHDFADAWANAIENTPCYGGWFGKDRVAGVPPDMWSIKSNINFNCLLHDEAGGWPRLVEPGTDHFPEHRKSNQKGEYSDMQIAAAALWAVREGIRSKDLALGTNWYFERFVKTLRTTGWLGQVVSNGPTPSTDWNVYRALVDLEVKMLNQWATSGAATSHLGAYTSNKVTAGFAKIGIFLISTACIDQDQGSNCPNTVTGKEDNGGDAVIDIDDDYLNRSGTEPTFLVWTGPHYLFANETASNVVPAPCNAEYQVEVADNVNFNNQRVTGWLPVPPTGECFFSRPLETADWNALKGTTGETKLYYRVRTRMSESQGVNVNERVSTSPGSHLFEVPPPYAIVNATGTPQLTDTTPPTTPNNLTVSAVFSSQINLAWSASTDDMGVAGYYVLRNGTQIGPLTTTSYTDTGLSKSTTYRYTVAAFDTAGNVSAQSPTVTATTLTPQLPDTTPPTVPSGLQGFTITPSSIFVSWSESTDNVGVAGYNVFRDGTQVGTSTTASYSDTKLSKSTTYRYTVAAFDAAENVSAQSRAVTATTFSPHIPDLEGKTGLDAVERSPKANQSGPAF